jgi:hypothetical protein
MGWRGGEDGGGLDTEGTGVQGRWGNKSRIHRTETVEDGGLGGLGCIRGVEEQTRARCRTKSATLMDIMTGLIRHESGLAGGEGDGVDGRGVGGRGQGDATADEADDGADGLEGAKRSLRNDGLGIRLRQCNLLFSCDYVTGVHSLLVR